MAYKQDFPIFSKAGHEALTYLDSASSAQKQAIVINALRDLMEGGYANIHRGLYGLSQDTTAQFEAVRGKVSKFINSAREEEIIFTRNTTEAINLVARSWGAENLGQGDEIILSAAEHHANIVPWQMLQAEKGFDIKVLPILDNGELDVECLPELLSPQTKLISFTHASNVLGIINPAKEIIAQVKACNSEIVTLIDASQSAVHLDIDVQDLGADFLCFTGHKLYGPSGAGVLYGRYELLENMAPYQGGGDMIENVSFAGTSFAQPPARFEAGTPAIIEVIGLGAAIDYVEGIGKDKIHAHESAIFKALQDFMRNFDGVTLQGDRDHKLPVMSFTTDWAHPSDMNMVLDQCGVCVRSGLHCAEPLMERLGLRESGSLRVSLGVYNDMDDVERFKTAMHKAYKMLG